MKALLILSSILLLAACTNEEPKAPRKDVPKYEKPKPGETPKLEKLGEPLMQDTLSACEQIAMLKSSDIHSNSYSFLAKFNGESGAINIQQSPFVQLIVSENIEIPDADDFYKQAKEQYENGELSAIKWIVLKAAYKTGIGYDALRYSTINGMIKEKFPGIYGGKDPLEGSLSEALLKRTLKDDDALELSEPFAEILTSEIPLFTSAQWGGLVDDSLSSLSAAIKALSDQSEMTLTSLDERICSLVLLQRSFAQLLRIKGHLTPSFSDSEVPRLTKLNHEDYPAFEIEFVNGSFLNTASEPIVLPSDEISTYDPKNKLYMLSNKTPVNGRSGEAATLKERISYLNSMVNFYQATSPASPWVTAPENYLLGDITESDNALLPFEAHTLALGLLTLEFKNIAHTSVHMLNSKGAIAVEGETVAGAMLATIPHNSSVAMVSLDNILEITKAVVWLDHALTHFENKDIDWEIRHPLYNDLTLAQLLGKRLFTDEDLREIFPDGSFDNSTTLGAQLKKLQLPLAILINKFTSSECASKVSWNSLTGELLPVERCSEDIQKKAIRVKNILARHTNSPVLWTPESL